MSKNGWQVIGFAVVVVALGVAGCSRTSHRIPNAAPADPPELYQPFNVPAGLPEQLVDRPPYRLNVGDVLEVIYQVKNVVSDKPYALKIEDIVKVAFPYQEKFDQEVTVQADGSIRCLLTGGIRAEGLSAAELEGQLKRAYSRYIRDPELTVVTEAANVKIEELKKAITTAPRGQSRLVPIKPDGTIDLPYIGESRVAGLTVNEAKLALDQRYRENDLEEVEVTVQTLHFATKKIYVMGEVEFEGLIESNAPITLLQAITRSGGTNVRADTSKILLVHRNLLPLPEAIVFDMEDLLKSQKPSRFGRVPNGSRFRYDMYLADGDLVYVPPTGLAEATDWIDMVFTKGVRAVFPYSGVLGMNFGYQIYNPESAVKSRVVGPPQINTQVGP
ncbi:MAG: polysaccharide biosynthesis/export family protein [Planctomycetota bacterium]